MSSRRARATAVAVITGAALITIAATLWPPSAPAPQPGATATGVRTSAEVVEPPGLLPVPRKGSGSINLAGGVYDAAGNPVAGAEITAEFELGPGVTSLAPALTSGSPGDAAAPPADEAGAQPPADEAGVQPPADEAGGAPPADEADEPGVVLHTAVAAVAGADGQFELEGLVEGRYRLRVEGPGIFTSEVRFFDVPADGIRLIVARQVSVRGKVVDAAGQPAPGVEVSLSGELEGGVSTTRTDAGGAFAFEELEEGVFQIWAVHGDRAAPAARISRLGPGPFDDVTLALAPATIVAGRVVDQATGQGVAAAITLSATSSDEPTRHATSSPDGNFRIEGVPAGTWSAAAHAPGYVAVEAIEFSAGGAFSPVIELVPGAVIAGRVVDIAGSPVPGAVVSARGTDADGRPVVFTEDAELRRLRLASGLGTRGMPGSEPQPQDDARFVARGELGVLLGPIPFPPPRGSAALRIARALEQGSAPAAPELAVHPEAVSTFITDEQGRFRLAGLEAGTIRLVATHAVYADALGKPLEIRLGQRLHDVTLVMAAGVLIVGTVTNQRGELIVGAAVIADPAPQRSARAGRPPEEPDGATRLQAVTGVDGRYELGPIAADVSLRVTAVRHGDEERTIRLGKLGLAREERTEDFVLPVADATIAGRLRDPMGFPVRGAAIHIDDVRGSRVSRWQGASDDSGLFAIDRLPPGSYAVRVEHPDFPVLSMSGSTEADMEITLPFGGGIESEVRDAHNQGPVSGALVVATGPGKEQVETAAKDDGGVDLAPLRAGTWTLRTSAPGYIPRVESVEVPAGGRPREVTVRGLRIALERGATVAGTVRDRNGVRVRGAEVSAGEVRATTDEHGAFRLRDVPTGQVEIRATRRDARGSITVPLSPGDELVTLEIQLEGEGG